jgi:hypothetical protein
VADKKDKAGKKLYATPKLQVHGDIRELTRTTGGNGNSDGGTKAHKRTA